MKSQDPADPADHNPRLLLPESATTAFELLSRRWVLQLLYLLCQSEARFNELAHAMPTISHRVLMERLRTLQHEGLIHRNVDPGPLTRITYRITDLGSSLWPSLQHANTWGAQYLTTNHPT
ncbi:helix-turn-helix domain-containing protein [Actinomadura fulvescens]|uniref:HTH hxlR-type domain-containing protein n=1 Tax=Actinomadura fulvescens TaxID=46160 RepID=A0ABN3QWY4_9ACTN